MTDKYLKWKNNKALKKLSYEEQLEAAMNDVDPNNELDDEAFTKAIEPYVNKIESRQRWNDERQFIRKFIPKSRSRGYSRYWVAGRTFYLRQFHRR